MKNRQFDRICQFYIQMLMQFNIGRQYILMEKGAPFIKQIKLMGNKTYFPNKYYSPYEFMEKLNHAIKDRYNLQVIQVKYTISKSKGVKEIEDNLPIEMVPEPQFNNIFDIQDQFLKDLLADVKVLAPINDLEAMKYEQELQMAKKQKEQKKIVEIDEALNLLGKVISKEKYAGPTLKSIARFKGQLLPNLKQSQVDIYIKVVITEPVLQKLQQDKNAKSPVAVATSDKKEIRVFFHPCQNDPQDIRLMADLDPITQWSLCSKLPQSQKSGNGISYWQMGDLSRRAQEINSSVKIANYISLHRNKKDNIDALQVYSFLFNQIVMKISISLAQITKIEYYQLHDEKQKNVYEFYLHLAYPPKYFLALLKPQLGSDDGFIRNWDRVENFIFLRNKDIMKDDFLRLFLFNNTIFKIKMTDANPEIRVDKARERIHRLINDFKGTINCFKVQKPMDVSRRLTSLSTIFKYKSFKDKMSVSLSSIEDDKLWKIKYMILVLIRYNCLLPSEVEGIMQLIMKAKQDIDTFIYILWKSVISLGAVTSFLYECNYLAYIQKEFQQIKKLSYADIMSKTTSNTEEITYVFKASLTPSGYLYNPPTPEMKGRLLKQYAKESQHFFRVSIADQSEGTLKNQRYLTKKALNERMQNFEIIQRNYIPLGWSPSQLRSYSLWYMHEYRKQEDSLNRQQVLSFLGNFDKITNPAKKAARIGQAFSSSWTYHCKPNEIKEIYIADDKSSKEFLFTDGIGKISQDLLERISLKLKIRDLSIVQVRYKGAKGILVLDSSLSPRTIVLRDSMIKYPCKHDRAALYLDILDWNKYKAGFLNRQVIILLKSLGLSDKVFEKKQANHIQRISNLTFKDCSIFKHMNQDLNTDINNLEPANVTILHLLRAGFKLQNQPFFRGVLQTMKKNGYHQLKIKSNILIQKSARIIGIIDEWDILNEGELYCTVFDHMLTEPKKQHVQGDVIITRNPCLHPADIRKMRCISIQQVAQRCQEKGISNILLDYVNCIIFPKKGEIPVTAQISGSDLDGDNFFICWDPELIPKQVQPIYMIDQPTQNNNNNPQTDVKVTYQSMLDFFVQYINYEKLGQIDNSHLVKADKGIFFAKEKDCIQLAVIHGKAVDFPKSGYCPQVNPRLLVSSYPDFMQKEETPEYQSESILGRLYRDIKHRIQNLLKDCEDQKTGKIDDQIIRDLLIDQDKSFEQSQIKEALSIILDYQRQLDGLIRLVGVESQYEIYSGNFTIAKEKVKVFGKNRLIATILNLRARYFDLFFAHTSLDKQTYAQAKEKDLQNPNLFDESTRKRALLFYLCSYVIKFSLDQHFLADQHFSPLRQRILDQFQGMTLKKQGKFCGFVWFVVPKIIINQKYRINRIAQREKLIVQEQQQQSPKNNEIIDSDQQEVI